MISIKIKLKEGSILPKKANDYASGYDCYAYLIPGIIEQDIIHPGEHKLVSLGFSMEIPEGYEARIRSRSGLAKDGIVTVHGTIDCDYRGVLMANVFNNSFKSFSIRHGMRICQMVIQEVPKTELVVCEELSETDRGVKGFGSSGL